jgi:hypothetical protein
MDMSLFNLFQDYSGSWHATVNFQRDANRNIVIGLCCHYSGSWHVALNFYIKHTVHGMGMHSVGMHEVGVHDDWRCAA